MIRHRKQQTSTTRPAHGVTAWLSAIPRRTVVVLVDHSDPTTVGKFDSKGNPLRPRIEYQGRATRRAYAHARHIDVPASALVTYHAA
jgi:hypothetical protein